MKVLALDLDSVNIYGIEKEITEDGLNISVVHDITDSTWTDKVRGKESCSISKNLDGEVILTICDQELHIPMCDMEGLHILCKTFAEQYDWKFLKTEEF